MVPIDPAGTLPDGGQWARCVVEGGGNGCVDAEWSSCGDVRHVGNAWGNHSVTGLRLRFSKGTARAS